MKVSILIPSYNHARFLAECLESVQTQTWEDWEGILVDDGSQDSSVEQARIFAQKEPRLQVHINAQNRGTYGTLQRALEMSSGGLIAILNSDDAWRPEKLERQLAVLKKHPEAAAAYTFGLLVDEDGAPFRTQDHHFDWPTGEIQDLVPFLLYENRVLASSVVFRREGLRFEPSLRYSGDWVALLEAASRGPIACVSEPLSVWRQHGHNTYVQSPAQMLEEIRVRRAIAEIPFASENQRDGLGRNAMNLAALYAFFGDGAEVRRWGWKAIGLRRNRRAAWRRFLSAFVSSKRRRRHFWPNAEQSLPSDELGTWREKIAQLPELALRVNP